MRVFLIVLDSVGIGNAPDALKFHDEGSNTLNTCYKSGKRQFHSYSRGEKTTRCNQMRTQNCPCDNS